MQNPPDVVAVTELIFDKPDGGRLSGQMYIGRPVKIEGHPWRCPVGVTGLFGELPDIAGADPLHSMWLAMQLLKRLLTDFVQNGGKVSFMGSELEFDPAKYFVNIPSD